MSEYGNTVLRQLAILLVAVAVVGFIMFWWVARRLRKLPLAPNAGFASTLRVVPLALVVALDLLDFGLNVLSAPITWFLLSRFKLQGLRRWAVIKDLIPFDGPIPLLTLAWVAVRVFKLGDQPGHYGAVIEAEEHEPGRYVSRSER
ncbi:MAG: hypothetical protein NVS4B8_12110 [Herpetosiphon sp.]